MNLLFKFQLLAFTSSRKLEQEVRIEMGSSTSEGQGEENLPYFY